MTDDFSNYMAQSSLTSILFLSVRRLLLCHMAKFPLLLFSIPASRQASAASSPTVPKMYQHLGKSGGIMFPSCSRTCCAGLAAGMQNNSTHGVLMLGSRNDDQSLVYIKKSPCPIYSSSSLSEVSLCRSECFVTHSAIFLECWDYRHGPSCVAEK